VSGGLATVGDVTVSYPIAYTDLADTAGISDLAVSVAASAVVYADAVASSDLGTGLMGSATAQAVSDVSSIPDTSATFYGAAAVLVDSTSISDSQLSIRSSAVSLSDLTLTNDITASLFGHLSGSQDIGLIQDSSLSYLSSYCATQDLAHGVDYSDSVLSGQAISFVYDSASVYETIATLIGGSSTASTVSYAHDTCAVYVEVMYAAYAAIAALDSLQLDHWLWVGVEDQASLSENSLGLFSALSSAPDVGGVSDLPVSLAEYVLVWPDLVGSVDNASQVNTFIYTIADAGGIGSALWASAGATLAAFELLRTTDDFFAYSRASASVLDLGWTEDELVVVADISLNPSPLTPVVVAVMVNKPPDTPVARATVLAIPYNNPPAAPVGTATEV
jgi:hypothetical protein